MLDEGNDIFLVILTLRTKPLSPSLESSNSISGHDGEEKYKGSLTLRQYFYWLSYPGSGRDIVLFKCNVFEMVSGFHY